MYGLFFAKKSINGEVIFMLMTKNLIIHPFFVFKIKKIEVSSRIVNVVVIFKNMQNQAMA